MFLHRKPLIHRHDTVQRGRAVFESALWPDCVVMTAPLFDQGSGFTKAVEDFASQQRVSEPAIDASTLSIFPRCPWFDVGCLCLDRRNPNLNCLSKELRAIVRHEEGGSERTATECFILFCRGIPSSVTFQRYVTAQGLRTCAGILNLRRTLPKVAIQSPPA